MSEVSQNLPRVRFAEAMSSVKWGTSASQVLSAIGTPDARHHRDAVLPTGLFPETSEIWYYGLAGPHAFPTLGQVWLGIDGVVKAVTGGGSVDSAVINLPEEELRDHLAFISQLPTPEGDSFDPLLVIQTVNRLQPLDVQTSCGIALEYLRVAGFERVYVEPSIALVFRVLMDELVHPPLLPVTYFGTPHPPPPANISMYPRFPIRLDSDVPLLFVQHYTPRMTSGIHTIEPLLRHYHEFGSHRPHRLQPSNRPLDMLFQILEANAWKQAGWSADDQKKLKRVLMTQLLKLGRVIHQNDRALPGDLDGEELDWLWMEHVRRFNALNPIWDSAIDNYRLG